MERKPFTLRLKPELYKALQSLSDVEHRSMNDIAAEAVSKLVISESKLVARKLEKTIANLRAYAERDPGFEQAIAEFAAAEAQHDDPLEGSAVVKDVAVRRQVQALLTDA